MSYWSFEQQISKNDVLYYGVFGYEMGSALSRIKV